MSSAAPIAATAVILAAGQGTRMKSRHPKAVHRILGKPMVAFPAEICRALGIARVIVVVPPGGAVQSALGDGFEYVEQAQPLGSADALRAAVAVLGETSGPVVILAACQPAISPESIRELLELHRVGGVIAAVGSGGKLPRVPGVLPCVICAETLKTTCDELPSQGASEVTEVSDLLRRLDGHGHPVQFIARHEMEHWVQVGDRRELAHVTAYIRGLILREHMLNGVTIEDPANTYIEPGVIIGQDTVIRPQTFLSSGTVIGEECEIGPFVRISNCRLGDRISIQSAVLADSEVGDDTNIGPFAQLRPGCKVGRKVKIGNFVELKNTTAEDRASMGHFAYLGDAFIGEKSNIGAGTITCNYDGKKKHRTHIGRNAFVGTHATLVAPVTVGDGAFIAAGSVVTEEVPADALAIGRGRQVNKPDWAKQRRERE